ncbi:hypothetical protein AB8Z38_15905 [Bradyrhizobium sp. LLZ17]|uniref:Ligase n=1 Tax=Bradyrhizobium sp. LLZ17 TaxID=3239388 RepID=A0AB39XSC9_9BRAD
MSSTTAPPADSPTAPIIDYQPITELTGTGRAVVWFSIVSFFFLTQIAYNIGEFPVAVDLISYAVFTAYLVTSGNAALSVPSAYLLVCLVGLGGFRIPFSTSSSSWSSLLLLCSLYVPFLFRLVRRPQLRPVADYIIAVYVTVASVIAAVGLVQLVLVNAAKMSTLTNIYYVLPDAIRGAGHYTRFREDSGITKANGFFLRESADLSLVTALAILLEYQSRRRLATLVLLGAGLLASLSGSGLVALAAAFLLPKSLSRVPLFVALAAGLALVLIVLYSLDSPVLNLWFGRLSEFGQTGTSAYARFQAPMDMIERSFDKGILTTWFGSGAGSFFRDLATAHFKYEVADPTWAKLIYEYGIIGFILLLALFLLRLYSSSAPIEVCNFFLLSWISFSLVLKPGYALIIWLLTLVPSMSGPTGGGGQAKYDAK